MNKVLENLIERGFPKDLKRRSCVVLEIEQRHTGVYIDEAERADPKRKGEAQ